MRLLRAKRASSETSRIVRCISTPSVVESDTKGLSPLENTYPSPIVENGVWPILRRRGTSNHPTVQALEQIEQHIQEQ
jgi:hypothetical protein